jgi:nucleotide-binding universal stress UspA family protein
MSIFPTKILLATDGSEEATLAAQTAVDIADKTNSELHLVYVGELDYGDPGYDPVMPYPTMSTGNKYRRTLSRKLEKHWTPR